MRQALNRSGDIEVFVRVVELGGFSAAARSLGMSPSAVSKLIARLEARLGARLVIRSTRRLQLTPEGAAFYERGARILGEIDAAESEAGSGAAPRGRLRVSVNVPFGMDHLLPIIPEFLACHPGISIDLSLTDRVVDLVEERADVAIRVGPLRASRLLARKLGESRNHVVASPAYLERHGTPTTLAEFERHNRIGFGFARIVEGWPFRDDGGVVNVAPAGNALVSDGEAMRRLVLAGLGIGRLSSFQVGPDIAAGRLVAVMEHLNPGDTDPVHAVFVGHGRHMPARVRAFLDFLAANVRVV